MSKAIAVTNSVEGNIGDCKVNEESYNVSFWIREVTVTDSCTGQIIAQNQMFDHGFVWFGLVLLIVVLIFWSTSY